MYLSRFGLQQRPFRSTPDLATYYPATGHEQALEQLCQGLHDEEGVVLLTGEPGSGKTLLCHCLLERLGDQVRSAYLTNTHFADRHALLQALCYDLELPHDGGEQQLRLALADACLRGFAEGKPTIVVVDEAQHLTADMLEELRLLANLEGPQGRAVQVVLAGQPALLETLEQPGLAALRQRLAVRTFVPALTLTEAADYLLHQLRVAGAQPDQLLPQEALELLARSTRGQPRLLNQAAHRSLALACAAGSQSVDVEAVLEALSVLGIEVLEEAEEPTAFEPLPPVQETPAAETRPLWQTVLPLNGDHDDKRRRNGPSNRSA